MPLSRSANSSANARSFGDPLPRLPRWLTNDSTLPGVDHQQQRLSTRPSSSSSSSAASRHLEIEVGVPSDSVSDVFGHG